MLEAIHLRNGCRCQTVMHPGGRRKVPSAHCAPPRARCVRFTNVQTAEGFHATDARESAVEDIVARLYITMRSRHPNHVTQHIRHVAGAVAGMGWAGLTCIDGATVPNRSVEFYPPNRLGKPLGYSDTLETVCTYLYSY